MVIPVLVKATLVFKTARLTSPSMLLRVVSVRMHPSARPDLLHSDFMVHRTMMSRFPPESSAVRRRVPTWKTGAS